MYYLIAFIILFSIALPFMLPFFIYTKRRKIRVACFSKTQYTLHDLRRFLEKEYTISILLHLPLSVAYILAGAFPHNIMEIIYVDRKIHENKPTKKPIKKPQIDTELGKQLWHMYTRAFYAEYAVPVETYFLPEKGHPIPKQKRIRPVLFRILCIILLLIDTLHYLFNVTPHKPVSSYYSSRNPFFTNLLLYPPLVILLVTELYNFLRKKSAVKEPEETFPEELPQTPPSQQSWHCTCGRANPSYIYTCVCGESKESTLSNNH